MDFFTFYNWLIITYMEQKNFHALKCLLDINAFLYIIEHEQKSEEEKNEALMEIYYIYTSFCYNSDIDDDYVRCVINGTVKLLIQNISDTFIKMSKPSLCYRVV